MNGTVVDPLIILWLVDGAVLVLVVRQSFGGGMAPSRAELIPIAASCGGIQPHDSMTSMRLMLKKE